IAVDGVFVTSGTPLRSRIRPRGAGNRRTRNEFACAWATYFWPASTCSAHSRRKSAAKIASRTPPRIATRSASFGVTRYGSTTDLPRRGSLRGARSVVVLAKQLHLRCVITVGTRTQKPACECVRRRRQDEI